MEISHKNKDEYIHALEQRVQYLERKESLRKYVFPYNAFVDGDVIHFCYDEDQRKPLDKNDKMIFQIKTISLVSFENFVKKNAADLFIKQWVCSEGGSGYYSNRIDDQLYKECFTSRLSECLFKMIESDNELKMSLLTREIKSYHERNR